MLQIFPGQRDENLESRGQSALGACQVIHGHVTHVFAGEINIFVCVIFESDTTDLSVFLTLDVGGICLPAAELGLKSSQHIWTVSKGPDRRRQSCKSFSRKLLCCRGDIRGKVYFP